MSKRNRREPAASAPAAPSTDGRVVFVLWVCVAWMAVVAAKFFLTTGIPFFESPVSLADPNPPSSFLPVLKEYALALFFAFTFALGAAGAGYLALKKISGFSSLGRLVMSGGLGLGILAYLIYFLGLLQLYRPPVFYALWAVLLAALAAAFFSGLRQTFSEAKADLSVVISQSPVVFLVPLALLLLIGIMMSLVPEVFYDSLVYHLGVPRWYLLEGGIKEYPNLHSNYPLTLQMLYVAGMGVAGPLCSKLFHWIGGFYLALAFISWAKEKNVPQTGVWMALVFLTMPMVQYNMWVAGTDVGVSLFAALCAWSWGEYISKDAQAQPARGLLLLSGVFAGLCLGSKLTSGVVVAVLGAVHFLYGMARKKSMGQVILECALIGFTAFLVALPWLVRAYVFTGNPVFPFLGKFFPTLDAGRMATFMGESKGVTPQNFFQWLILPWKLTFEGLSGLSFMGPLLLAFFPVLIIYVLNKSESLEDKKFIFLFGLLGCLGLVFLNRLTRYWLPYFAILILPMGWAVGKAMLASAFFKWGTILLTFLMVIMNFFQGWRIIWTEYDPWNVLMGKESSAFYRSRQHTGLNAFPGSAMLEWANANLPKDSKILIFGDDKVADSKVRFTSAGTYDRPLLEVWTEGVADDSALYQRFQKEKVTHIFVNVPEGRRLVDYKIIDWPESSMAVIANFWDKHVRFVQEVDIPTENKDNRLPLLMYAVVSEEEGKKNQIPWNSILWIYEEYKVGNVTGERKVEKLVDFYAALSKNFPQTPAFTQRYQLLVAQQAAASRLNSSK